MRATTKIIFPIIIFIVALATFGCGGSENGDTNIIEPATTATEVGGADGAALFADTCAVQEGHQGAPNCTVTMEADTYISIERGDMNPQVAYMTGKVKVSDVIEMSRFAKAFNPAPR